MNAIDLLKVDHRVVDALFTQAESLQPAKRGPIYKKISNELAAHAHIEETIFYPRLRKKGDKELNKIVLEGIEEHGQIHKFHDELDQMQPTHERFEPKFMVLREDIRHHVKEEEGEMFDLVESQFSSEELEKLGAEMEAEKLRYQKENGIPPRTAKDNELGQSMLARMVDAVTGMFSGGEKQRSGSKARTSTAAKSRSASASSRKTSAGSKKTTGTSTKSSGTRSASTGSGSKTAKSSGSSKSSGSRSSAKSTKSGSSGSSKSAGNGKSASGRSSSGTSKSSKSASTGSSKSKSASTKTSSRSRSSK